MSYKDLYAYVSERILDNKRYYLFLDELHRINQWENASNSFCIDFNCDIYILRALIHIYYHQNIPPIWRGGM